VILAITRGSESYQGRLHDAERPIALVSTMIASQNRDPKKGKGPTYTDFCFYKPMTGANRPDYVYGSAYMTLIDQKRMPQWALTFFASFKGSANAEYVPVDVALVADDAILLHPEHKGNGRYEGLLLALESASEQPRQFVDDQGQRIVLMLPKVDTKVIAEDEVTLYPLGHAPMS